jgi:hypothetical protein
MPSGSAILEIPDRWAERRNDARAPFAAIVLSTMVASTAFADDQDFDRIERGRYLALAGDCAACHTAPGGRLFAGGLALQTPFGTLVTPNITPDRETGIGDWSMDELPPCMMAGVTMASASIRRCLIPLTPR